MIGTPHSEKRLRLMTCLALALSALSGARADQILLEGGKLSGTIDSIDSSGAILLQTPLAPAPVGIQPAAVRKIIFSEPAGNHPQPDSLVELSNGDKLPGDIKSYLDGSFEVATWYADSIRLPRAAVSAIHFGIRQDHQVFNGPGQITDWRQRDGWTIEDNELVAKSSGVIRRQLDVPGSFRFRGHLSWSGQQNQPNIWIYFAETAPPEGGKSDCYILTFSYAGLELKRQNSKGRPWNSIHIFNLRPEDFQKQGFEFEVRLNRAGAQPVLELLIDGESKGRFQDVSSSSATGGGIAFRANEGSELHVGGLEITSWDAKGDIFRGENRGDASKDSVIYDKGQRTSGELLEIRSLPAPAKVIFKSPVGGRLELPADVVSSIFLAKSGMPASPQPYVISLRGGGKLNATLQSSKGDRILVIHPLAGALAIPRVAITMIERPSAPAKP